ncbi:MAG: MBL fold metallo-hydrolase [Deltaproteobacteria bacterium]|nr:MBL fold metallo-hydrolase [Deltaproteobacteria bacterium]
MTNEPKQTVKPSPRWRRLRRVAIGGGLLLIIGAGVLLATAWTSMGTAPTGERLERMGQSPHFETDIFVNDLPMEQGPISEMAGEWFFGGGADRTPATPPPIDTNTAQTLASAPASGLRVTWMGHSSMLIEIDGQRFLTDPVWSERCSPWTSMGPARFHPTPVPVESLLPLDAVVISHDHYDHLDTATIRSLAHEVGRFIVPLGVGAHLEYWGVEPERITEHDWWDETEIGGVRVVCTPARHFSGRAVTDKDRTLWASWSFIGPEHRAYFSGDTGMHPGFTEIGQRLGPFDVTMIEVGAYHRLWADVHLGPEQAVHAHQMLRGDVMLPVHWGTFDLALHSWTEPIERLVVEAHDAGITLVAPRAGEPIEPGAPPAVAHWWPIIPWETDREHPIISSHLPASLGRQARALVPVSGPRP